MGMAMQQVNASTDEIDLVALLQALWRQKILILVIALACAAVAVGYAFLATPYYKTTTYLRPSDRSSLDQLNETGIYKLAPDEALGRVAASLSSYDLRREFFRQHPDLFEPIMRDGRPDQLSFSDFNEKAFEVLRPDPKRTDDRNAYVGLALTYPAQMDGVSVVNEFVDFVLDHEREAIGREVAHLAANRLVGLEGQIAAGRAAYESSKESEIAALLEKDAIKAAELQAERDALRIQLRTKRDNRIVQLEEAIGIAESLGIKKPSPLLALNTATIDRGTGQTPNTDGLETPLYFLGSEALSAEREALLARESDDFAEPRIAEIEKELALLERNPQVELMRQRDTDDLFLADLANWRKEAAHLKAIDLDVEALKLVRLDQPAMTPSGPLKPRRALVVALGLVLGSMLGIFVALVRALLMSNSRVQPI